MKQRFSVSRVVLFATVLSTAACPERPVGDAGTDAVSDTSDAPDERTDTAAAETSTDVASSDAHTDASATDDGAIDGASPSDAAGDTGLDTRDDGARDAGTDTRESFDAGTDGGRDAGPDGASEASAPMGPLFCSLGTPVDGLVAPPGYCIRRYARLSHPRAMVFAPNGDLFVSSPRTFSPGGGGGGVGAVQIVTDDDRDGVGTVGTFASTQRNAAGAVVMGIPDVHGVALGGGYLYFTTQQQIFRTPYALGQRTETPGAVESLRLDASVFDGESMFGSRWTHGLAIASDGRVFTSRGQYGSCGMPQTGSIFRAQSGSLDVVATGFRNPMYLRCHPRDPLCVAAELGEDGQTGAIEKLVAFTTRTGDYGYPCCQSQGRGSNGMASSSCDDKQREERSFPLGDTPFGLDWERGVFAEAHRGAIFVAMHGSFYVSGPRWQGAGIRFARVDPASGLPYENFTEFMGRANGIGERLPLVRPADIAFAPDGRMFVADDHGGGIYWIAPESLRAPAR